MQMTNIKWPWVAIGVFVALLVTFAGSLCVVTAYATLQGFQAQGAPDFDNIISFADAYAADITSIFAFAGTFVGGYLAARRAKEAAQANGSLVGFATGGVLLGAGILGSFSLWTLVGAALAILGGWLAGRVAGRSPATA